MATANVSRSLIGKTLLENVMIENGGILFPKDHTFSEGDLVFLVAFKIASVEIKAPLEKKEEKPSAKEEQTQKEAPPPPPFITQYEQAAAYMEKLVRNVCGGESIPVMEIRTWLRPLIDQVNHPTAWVMALQTYKGIAQYTYYHMVSVALVSAMIARANQFPETDIMQIALAGLLSDIGKGKIDPRILLKAGPLTPEEFAEMKNHTIYGYNMIKNTKGLSEGVALAALQHHERMDGKGYPLGLMADQIHIYAKIVAIADVFHAISSLRAYKDRESPIHALEQIRYDNVGKFDPALVHKFVASVTQFPLGTVVRLNDGRLGKMIYVDPIHPTRPTVDIDGEIIPLTHNKQLYIAEIVS